MKPRVTLATAHTPSGGEMVLYRHDVDFSITVDGQNLMHSRQNESELELARLGCAHLVGRPTQFTHYHSGARYAHPRRPSGSG